MSRSVHRSVLALLGVLAGGAAAGERCAAQQLRFADVTSRTGVDFVHRSGSREKDWITEVNGSGVALFDHDGDGDLDIFLVNGAMHEPGAGESAPSDALFDNEGGWRFRDATAAAGVRDEGWGAGASVADVDNDGRLDLYVTNFGVNSLYRGRGGGRFERASGSGAEVAGWSASASFADFDRDGLVDVYIATYIRFVPRAEKRRGTPDCVYKGRRIFCGPGGLDPEPDVLLLNSGGGRFRDATAEWGAGSVEPSYGLGTLVLDVDRDGWPDVFVANDTKRDLLFLNDRGRRFTEAAIFLGLAYNDYGVEQASMGVASGDVRGIGRDDIFITTFEDDTNTLHLAEGGGAYSEGTYAAGLGSASYPYLGWGCFFFDAEGDGDLDLFVANGHVAPQVDGLRTSIGYRQPLQLFANDGTGRFTEARNALPSRREDWRSARGAACGDLDGDGDPDIAVNNIDDRPTILENLSPPPPGGWLEVHLEGTRSNRAAIGARVAITCGGKRQERTIQSGMSYASQCELVARFGLGGCGEIASLEVDWPSGLRESFPPPERRSGPVRRTRLVEGKGTKL